MRNPLKKRYLRELKSDFGKYLAIALFMIMLVGLVSGYLVSAVSIEKTFYEGWDRYNIEDGHITFSYIPDEEVLERIESEAGLSFYPLEYFEEDIDDKGTTIRVFKDRTEVNKGCLLEGEMPQNSDEIAIDRIFANNNGIAIGDEITLSGKKIKVSGFVALVDYNCLFENNTDMMFNATLFGVGVMTEDGYASIDSKRLYHNYAWKYDVPPENETEENDRSEALMKVLETAIREYDESLVQAEMAELYKNANLFSADELAALADYRFDESKLLKVDNYVPKYQNKSITYCMDDMSSDKPMFIIFDYIVVAILAFVFAVTISSTIQKEAGVIGTLRASGYTKLELVRHYLFMPVSVTVLAAIIGNILGYTVFVNFMKNIFYTSFSLAKYESVFNPEAFVCTTIVPLILMIVINLYMLLDKLKISPIRFLRRDLAKKKKRRAMLLNKKLPFLLRFRLRILFQNISVYITLMLGIFLGSVIAVFGFMFGPLLDDYAGMIVEERICNYQYVLMDQIETDTEGAEKYCIEALNLTKEGYLTDEISVYGIEKDSSYITRDIPEGKILASEGILQKYKLNSGDRLTLKDPYSDQTYEFVIADAYKYSASLAIFMNRDEFNEIFDESEEYFTGFFSNKQITDIDAKDIATVITETDLTKVSDQMVDSIGQFMSIFKYFGAVMLALLMYLMTKQVIEKNAQSIAMTKILGFRNKEISGLYIYMSGFVVLLAYLLTVPLTDIILRWMFCDYLYKELSGYIPYIVSNKCYVYTFAIGAACYVLVSVCMFLKIGRIEKSEALKNVE